MATLAQTATAVGPNPGVEVWPLIFAFLVIFTFVVIIRWMRRRRSSK